MKYVATIEMYVNGHLEDKATFTEIDNRPDGKLVRPTYCDANEQMRLMMGKWVFFWHDVPAEITFKLKNPDGIKFI